MSFMQDCFKEQKQLHVNMNVRKGLLKEQLPKEQYKVYSAHQVFIGPRKMAPE